MKDGMTRRKFLWTSLLSGGAVAGAGAALPSLFRQGWAGGQGPDAPDRYYIFAYFSGGWDVLLSLDPRDPTQFHAGNVSQTLILPGYDQLDDDTNDGSLVVAGNGMAFGPYIGDLAQHADKLAVVRGMSMETLTHEAGMRRFITGKPPSGLLARGSSAATWLAGTLGEQQLIPNLSVNVESYNVDQPNYASALKVGSVPDLVRALSASPSQLGALEGRQVGDLLDKAATCPQPERSIFWQQAEAARKKSREMVQSGLDGLFAFQANTEAMAALRDHYGIPTTGPGATTGPEVEAAMAVTALTSGVSRVASVRLATGLDTHYDEWTRDQGPTQARGFAAVARMVEDLQGRQYGSTGSSWLDHTILIGFSEFSRTAMLNASTGRDHSLTNAAFLIGGPIQGGQFIGRSSDVGMAPTPTNLTTGLYDPGGEVVRPEHIIRALLSDAGVSEDVADLRVDPLLALLA